MDSECSLNADWLARLLSSQACAYRQQDPGAQVVFVRGKNATLWTVDDQPWLDLTSGYSATNFGHAYAPFVQVATQQLQQLTHLTGDPHVGRIKLAEQLLGLFRSHAVSDTLRNDLRVVFNATGARAVESAWKAVHAHRPGKLLVIEPGFHGRSVAASALSSTARSALAEPLEKFVTRLAVEPEHLQSVGHSEDDGGEAVYESEIFQTIQRQHAGLSGVLIDPALSARGYLLPTGSFLRRLRLVTREFRLPLIADEIQCGLGRCSRFSLSFDLGFTPDLVIFGKSLGGGISPISAVLGSAELLEAIPQGAESETFAATPLACEVALQVLSSLSDEENLVENGWRAAERLRVGLRQALNSLPNCHVGGSAGVCTLEFAAQGNSISAGRSQAQLFAQSAAHHRLRVQWTGPHQTRIVLLPPLTIQPEELRQALSRLADACQACLQGQAEN